MTSRKQNCMCWPVLDTATRNEYCREFKIAQDAGEIDVKQWPNGFGRLVEFLLPPSNNRGLSEEGQKVRSLLNARKLMDAACFNNHKMLPPFRILGSESDLFAAKGKRLWYILDCLSNFGSFRESFVEKFEALDKESTELLTEQSNMEKEGELLRAELEELRKIRDREAPAVAELQATNAALARSIKQLNEKQSVLKSQLDELKIQMDLQKRLKQGALESIQRLEERGEELKKRIVDPDKIRAQMDKDRRAIEFEKSENAARSAAIARINQKIEALDRIEQEVTKAAERLSMVKASAEHERTNKAKLSQMRVELEELKRQLKEQQTRHQTAVNNLQQCQDSISRLKKSRSEKMWQLNQELKDKIDAHKEAQQQSESTLRQIEHNNRMANEAEAKIAELREDHQAACQELQRTYDDLVLQVRHYHSQLRTVMVV